MKKIISILLVFCLLVCLVPFSASAVDNSRSYEISLTVNGSNEVWAKIGDVLTVNVTLRRTDSDASAPMYAFQDEIRYDDEFLEVVESGILTTNGIGTKNLTLLDGDRAFYMNFLSLNGGINWDSEVLLGSFQVRVLEDMGSTMLLNENVQIATKGGTDQYAVTVKDLLIILTDECIVHFDSCGGSPVEDQSLKLGDLVQKPKDPTREGYVFAGWYLEPELETLWDFENDTVRREMTLYAAWELAGTVHPEDPTAPNWLLPAGMILVAILLILILVVFGKKKVQFMVDGTVYHTVQVTRGGNLVLPVAPRKAGFCFAGWDDTTSGLCWDAGEHIVEKSMKLYAQWTQN